MVDRKLTKSKFHTYLNIERDMPIESEKIHGLTTDFLSDKPLFKEIAKEFVFQEELSDTGYKHYQGCFSLARKERLQAVKNLIGFHDIHLETCKNWGASKLYCSKKETRIGNVYTEDSCWVDIPELTEKWQLELRDFLTNNKPDPRTVIWFYDKHGGKGKTTFTKHLVLTNNDVFVCCNGKTADIACAIKRNPKIVIMDLPRTMETYVNYSAIENLKNGMIFSSKYESNLKIFNNPHVVIFANFKPNEDALSADRWDIREL